MYLHSWPYEFVSGIKVQLMSDIVRQWAIQQPAALTYEHLGVQLCSMMKKFMCFMTLMNLWVEIQLWKLSGYTRSHTLQSICYVHESLPHTPLSTHTPFTHFAGHLLCSWESSPHSTICTYTIHTPCRGSACWWNFSHCNESLSTIHEWSWLLPLGRGRLFVLHKTHPDPILIRSSVFRMPGAPLSTINLQLPCLLLQKHVMITSTITCRQAISFQVEHAQTGCFWGVHI